MITLFSQQCASQTSLSSSISGTDDKIISYDDRIFLGKVSWREMCNSSLPKRKDDKVVAIKDHFVELFRGQPEALPGGWWYPRQHILEQERTKGNPKNNF